MYLAGSKSAQVFISGESDNKIYIGKSRNTIVVQPVRNMTQQFCWSRLWHWIEICCIPALLSVYYCEPFFKVVAVCMGMDLYGERHLSNMEVETCSRAWVRYHLPFGYKYIPGISDCWLFSTQTNATTWPYWQNIILCFVNECVLMIRWWQDCNGLDKKPWYEVAHMFLHWHTSYMPPTHLWHTYHSHKLYPSSHCITICYASLGSVCMVFLYSRAMNVVWGVKYRSINYTFRVEWGREFCRERVSVACMQNTEAIQC